jgi:hypothetical protein
MKPQKLKVVMHGSYTERYRLGEWLIIASKETLIRCVPTVPPVKKNYFYGGNLIGTWSADA